MKTIVPALLLMMTFSAYAVVFDCQDGEEIDTLTIETHSATILDVTMINMMEMNWDLPYRGYTRIGDPWYALDVDMEMAKGRAGYAILKAHTLPAGEIVVSKFYQCTPRI